MSDWEAPREGHNTTDYIINIFSDEQNEYQ